MDLPEIPPELLGESEEHPGLFHTRYTTLAAILCTCAEIKWHPEESVQYYEKAGERFYEFKFVQNDLASRLNVCFQRHRAFVAASPDHWFARVLDVFHNRERLLELAKGPSATIRRGRRRIYLEAITGPAVNRTVLATDGKIVVDVLNLIALLLAHDELRLDRHAPLTIENGVYRFNFMPSAAFTRLCETFFVPERFVAANPEDWRSYAIGSLKNYGILVNEILPKAKLQQLQQRTIQTANGPFKRTQFMQPQEVIHGTSR